MDGEFNERLEALAQMSAGQLRDEYVRQFGEPPRSGHKRQLLRRIAWRMQALAEGDLSARARQRARQLADEAQLRLTPPRTHTLPDALQPDPKCRAAQTDRRLPMPGALLTRTYKGRSIQVKVLDKGFEYEGQKYRSLSAVTRAVTGCHWNGFHFFGVGQSKEASS
jgi:hypothetical protein